MILTVRQTAALFSMSPTAVQAARKQGLPSHVVDAIRWTGEHRPKWKVDLDKLRELLPDKYASNDDENAGESEGIEIVDGQIMPISAKVALDNPAAISAMVSAVRERRLAEREAYERDKRALIDRALELGWLDYKATVSTVHGMEGLRLLTRAIADYAEIPYSEMWANVIRPHFARENDLLMAQYGDDANPKLPKSIMDELLNLK